MTSVTSLAAAKEYIAIRCRNPADMRPGATGRKDMFTLFLRPHDMTMLVRPWTQKLELQEAFLGAFRETEREVHVGSSHRLDEPRILVS